MKLYLLLLSAILFVANAEKRLYTNYKLVRVFPSNQDQYKYINELEHIDDIDIWGTVTDGERKAIDLVLPPVKFEHYSRFFASENIDFLVLNENVQNMIDYEARSMKQNSRDILFKYVRYSDLMNFVSEVVENNPDIASTEIIGTTAENRILKVLKLRRGNPTKSIWIDCGIHAREWVSPASCVYTITKLVQELREGDPITTALFDKYDFHILPLHNPDGYEYTFTNERLWRKNRRVNTASECRGVDLNRNFPFYWLSGGSSPDPCSIVYAGPFEASESETRAVVSYVKARAGQWDAYFTVHTYGNWWLTSYGHSVSVLPPDLNLIMAAAKVAVDAIKAFDDQDYIAGPSAELLYILTGCSSDWAYSTGIRYSYTIELTPGEDSENGVYGFVCPEDQLPRKAPEAYIGIKALLDYISKL